MRLCHLALALLAVGFVPMLAGAEEEGVVRLGPNNEERIVRGQSGCDDPNCDVCAPVSCDDSCSQGCTSGACQSGCGTCNNGACGQGCNNGQCQNGDCPSCNDDCNGKSGKFKSWLKCKFGYFCPNGGCGEGLPLCGHYGMVYAINPGYTDARDGQQYAAPGYGTPVSVPLAPNVRYSYNYGWGVPSSRLTPIRQAQIVAPPVSAAIHGTTTRGY